MPRADDITTGVTRDGKVKKLWRDMRDVPEWMKKKPCQKCYQEEATRYFMDVFIGAKCFERIRKRLFKSLDGRKHRKRKKR